MVAFRPHNAACTQRDPTVKIVIAPDSFKESLSAPDAAAAIARGVHAACADADIVTIPMADGGEGTVAAVLAAAGGQWRSTDVTGALGAIAPAAWGWLGEDTAVIEMAAAAGLEQVPAERRDPLRATSRGVGELMRAALDAGARRIILGLGGSATNDGGAGMLSALGLRILDRQGAPVPDGGAALSQAVTIDADSLDARLAAVRIESRLRRRQSAVRAAWRIGGLRPAKARRPNRCGSWMPRSSISRTCVRACWGEMA